MTTSNNDEEATAISKFKSKLATGATKTKRRRKRKVSPTTTACSDGAGASGGVAAAPRATRIELNDNDDDNDSHSLLRSLQLLDTILQFLTRATQQSLVAIEIVRKTIPTTTTNNSSSGGGVPWEHLEKLIRHGVLQISNSPRGVPSSTQGTTRATTTDTATLQELQSLWTSTSSSSESSSSSYCNLQIGFPMPDERRLSGSTKAAAKRRMAYLKRQLLLLRKQQLQHDGVANGCTTGTTTNNNSNNNSASTASCEEVQRKTKKLRPEDAAGIQQSRKKEHKHHDREISNKEDGDQVEHQNVDKEEEPVFETMERNAKEALGELLGLVWCNKSSSLEAAATKKEDGQQQQNASSSLLGGDNGGADNTSNSSIPTSIIPNQAKYAGSNAAQAADYIGGGATLKEWKKKFLDVRLHDLMPNQVYRHQAISIESALGGISTLVCTGTGSGKSLCFLLPVLQAALVEGKVSILLFPTKALAQDQVVKLQSWLDEHGLGDTIRPRTLDGDTPHSQRAAIVSSQCNVILTNPDTLHAAILPNWKRLYKPIFQNLKYVVLDEAHMYQGVFGAHVAMILARLYRIACCCCQSKIIFLACSATLPHPEHHFRLLCCIPTNQQINIVTKDSSPRAAKHFWVWNPPLLDGNGKSTGRVQIPKRRKKKQGQDGSPLFVGALPEEEGGGGPVDLSTVNSAEQIDIKRSCALSFAPSSSSPPHPKNSKVWHRRHSADETALLLARAVSQGVRCIAFCKTRGLVEWVYERTLAALKQSPHTAKLTSQVESYRGGYIKSERRQIEKRLFQNELLGVVGTSALELGVDIGGVDLTLHCGFPSSHASLLQQAGRAGRGASACNRPSLAICICFNSPLDQHLWRYPKSLLQRGLSVPLSMPIYPGLVQGHLLCAGEEFPLVGSINVALVQSTESDVFEQDLISDEDLFGSKPVYEEAMETLLAQGSLSEESIPINDTQKSAVNGYKTVTVYKTHPSVKNPWTNVSIRSIEPISYDIVDVSHPLQGGKMDCIQNPLAVLDTIPYSRIFYHAFPGAIITHRSRRYKIISMTRPPATGKGFKGSMTLGAFARPCSDRYFTRPLSTMKITVVKQMERVDLLVREDNNANVSATTTTSTVKGNAAVLPSLPDASKVYDDIDLSSGSFAGCGVVNVKRNVHAYKKLSMVTREEFARSELSLPDMEYDSFGFWLDCDAERLGKVMTSEGLGNGIHALSHAILAVAPLFVPCVMNDVQCDHSIFRPTRVAVFDARAGGSGICAQLWKFVFVPNGLIQAAMRLLQDCPSCSMDAGYEGGCPACIQVSECSKFNDFLCKSSALIIGNHLMKRLKQTDLYKKNARELGNDRGNDGEETNNGENSYITKPQPEVVRCIEDTSDVLSPRRKAREKAMRKAKDISSARERLVVVGRPSWPMDRSDGGPSRQENHE